MGFTHVCHNRRKEKKIDFGVSLLEVILLVLVAFMDFIQINEVVMFTMIMIMIIIIIIVIIIICL